MALNDIPRTTGTSPTQGSVSPEDNAILQAIESIEAQSINPNPRPYDPADLTPKPAEAAVPKAHQVIEPVVVAPPIGTQAARPQEPIQPVAQPIEVVPPKPDEAPKLTTPPVAPEPPRLRDEPIQPPQTKAADTATSPAVKRRKPSTPAEAIADELENSPDISPEDAAFQPFPKSYPSKRSLAVIVSIAFGVLALGVIGYFALQAL